MNLKIFVLNEFQTLVQNSQVTDKNNLQRVSCVYLNLANQIIVQMHNFLQAQINSKRTGNQRNFVI